MNQQRSQSSGPLGRRASAPGTAAPPSTREASAAGRGRRSASRDSSSSRGREVRCACQFYQSDSLLPDRLSLVGTPGGTRPPSRGSAVASWRATMGDHEYEPISPPPQTPQGPPAVHVTNIEGITIQEPPEGPDAEPIMSDNDSMDSPVRRPVEEVPVPHDGDDEDRAMSSGEMGEPNGSLGGREEEMEQDDEFMTAAQMQQQMEDRFFAPTPTTMRTESRTTDAEFNTSNVDSSGLEDLPLTKEGRKNKSRFLAGGARAGAGGKTGRWGRFGGGSPSQSAAGGSGGSQPEGAAPETIQQRLRSGADRLKTRLSGISRPKLPAVRRPKFNLPDKAKFHLPDRPKFKMPERPKFKMPERPKINLGSLGRSSGAATASAVAASASATTAAGAENSDPEAQRAPEHTKKEAKKTASSKRPLKSRQYSTESTAGSSEKRRPLFDLNTFRTYPRMFRRNKADRGDSSSSPRSARSTRPITPPARSSFSSDTVKWMRRFSEAKYGVGDPTVAAIVYADHHTTPPPMDNNSRRVDEQQQERPQQQRQQPAPTFAVPTGNGDQMVYHISLHGTDSEPEYSDDQFQGPPYPEILPIDGDLEVVDHETRKARAEARAAAEAKAAREAAYQAQMEADRQAEESAAQMAEYRRQAQRRQQQGRSPRADRYADQDQDQDELSQEQDLSQDNADSERENRSSGTSSERHRRGVIEEIDSDEFFLRQKGISQEDVDVGRYIASEIREALRPSADYMDDEEDDVAPSPPPPRPQRTAGTRSLARTRKKKQKIYVPARMPRATPPGDEAEEEWEDDEQHGPSDDSYFNTFPPDRPARRRRSKKKQPAQQDYEMDEEDQRIQDDIAFSVAIQRQDLGILDLGPAADEYAAQQPPPLPPKRLRKSRSSNLNVHDDVPMIDDDEDDWGLAERRAEHAEMIALQNEADYIIPRAAPDGQQQQPPQTPPVPPTRGRKSRGGSRAGSRIGSRGTSLADEDRTSRGAESLPSERDDDMTLPDDGVHTLNEADVLRRMDEYARVEKHTAPPKPERPRRPKPPRPPAPGRRAKRAPPQSQGTASRLQNWRQFFSLPTRRTGKKAAKQAEVPVRPARNYSTLGPARPPRRGSMGSRHAPAVYTAAYLEIHTDDVELDNADPDNESSRADLQSGEVISKMKDRPLPAPPRPSRARKHQEKGDLDVEEPCQERIVPEHDRHPDPDAAASEDLTYAERKAAMAQLRDDFFSRSGEEPPEPPPAEATPIPTVVMTEPEQEPPTDSPYKSLRKKKKIPPLPQPEPQPEPEPETEAPEEQRPEEVSIAIQTDPLPDDLCVEESTTYAEDTSASKTWPTVVERQQLQQAPQEEQLQQEAPPPPPPARRPRRDSHDPSATPAPAPAAPTTPVAVQIELPESLQRLSVSDLDVERLSVSELRANKITVSEIDGMSLSVSEVHNRSSGGLQLTPGEPGSVELPSDLLQQLLPLSQSMSHALSQSLSESLAQSLSQTLSQIQDALSQPAELVQQQHMLQQQLERLQELQSQQQLQQSEQMQRQQQFQQQQQQLAQETLMQVEQQHAAVLHELQQQLHQLQMSAAAASQLQHSDVPPPIPPPPQVDVQTIQTQTSLELPGVSPSPSPTAPVAPPRGGVRPRPAPSALLGDSEEDEEVSAATAHSGHSLPRRRRPHHAAHKAPRYSSDEEEALQHQHAVASAPRRHRAPVLAAPPGGDSAPTPSLGEAGRQLARACRVSAINALAVLHQAAQPAVDAVGQAIGADPKRRDLQAALCLVLVLVTALILLGCGCAGGKDIHHHHWDFQFPPPH